MSSAKFQALLGVFVWIWLKGTNGQVSLDTEINKRPELSQFYAWVTRAQLGPNLGGAVRYTVFAPNNTAFQQMSAAKRLRFQSMTREAIANYVQSLSVYAKDLQTSSMVDETEMRSNGGNQERLFIAVKPSTGGQSGVNQYYINGARIINPDIRCSNGILQIIDYIPEPVSNNYVYGYLRDPDLPTLKTTIFFKEILSRLPETQYPTIPNFKQAPKITVFVPSDEAVQAIPSHKLQELQTNYVLLNQVIQRHYILNHVIHTSWVVHRQQFNTEGRDEKIIFRKIRTDNFPERVYVNSQGVNAEIIFGNITVANGVIHVIDSLLGYKYNSAMEQINQEPSLNTFSRLLTTAPADLQNMLRGQGSGAQITVFAPTNEALAAVENLVDFTSDRALAEKVIRYHLLEVGNVLIVMDVNKQYESREMRTTMYNRQLVVIYQRYNETFVEAGHVRAKIVKPDVGVTNGYVQYIDRVFGVPSKDIPTTICEDNWVYKSYLVLQSLYLDNYLMDRGLTVGSPGRTCQSSLLGHYYPNQYNNNYNRNYNNNNNQNRGTTNRYNQQTQNNYNQQNQNNYNQQNQNNYNPDNGPKTYTNYQDVPSEFTVFIANGSVLEYFEQTNLGRAIMKDNIRYKWVMRRHIIPRRTIFMDQLAQGDHYFETDNGEEIVVKKNGYGIRMFVEVIFGRKRAQVIHMDLGATNGVVHILRDILAVDEDRTRDVSKGNHVQTVSIVTLFVLAIFVHLL